MFAGLQAFAFDPLPVCLDGCLARHHLLQFSLQVGGLHLDKPPFVVRAAVDELGVLHQRFVDRHDGARDRQLDRALPPETLHTTETGWAIDDKTIIELYLIWHMTGVMDIIKEVDEGLFMILQDVMEERLEDAGYDETFD